MTETVNKQKLLDWLDVEIDLSAGSHEQLKKDRWAYRHTKKEVESGRLDCGSVQAYAVREQVGGYLAGINSYTGDLRFATLYADERSAYAFARKKERVVNIEILPDGTRREIL
ncbi:hypothetical protein [Cohnella sp. GbtcB17]|uniref:hypothetical protein n=1 Tax=Cohnella sp. GbtcB17 TaxID=2824762 RepID=UPI001C305889|nr:hypothetical protein [Cohnella sp. GbtcB17]